MGVWESAMRMLAEAYPSIPRSHGANRDKKFGIFNIKTGKRHGTLEFESLYEATQYIDINLDEELYEPMELGKVGFGEGR